MALLDTRWGHYLHLRPGLLFQGIQLFSPCISTMVQEKVRVQLGAQVTAFDSVEDGQQTLHSGDVLRLATKPVVVGRALHFIVGQASTCSFASVD